MPHTKRHILIMSSWFPTRIDPYVGNFVERYATLLASSCEVTCLHTIGDSSINSIEVVEEIENNVRYIRVYHPVSKNKLLHWWRQRSALRRGLIRIDHVDLLFAHVFLPRAYQFNKVQRYFHCPVVLLEHGSYFRKSIRKKLNSYQRSIIKQLSRHTQQILAVSEVLKNDMKPLFPTTPIEIVPNFIDRSIFFPRKTLNKNMVKFIHISTLDPKTKNPNLLFEGFLNAYLKADKQLKLTVVSDQDTTKWERWCKENSCEQAVRFIGPLEWDEIADEIRNHDAVLVTSEYETFNIVIAEAWSTGTPVISTEVGIAVNMPNSAGVLLKTNQIAELKQTILRAYHGEYSFDPNEIAKHATEFDAKIVHDKLVSIFQRHFVKYD